jgi:hypothetical protein
MGNVEPAPRWLLAGGPGVGATPRSPGQVCHVVPVGYLTVVLFDILIAIIIVAIAAVLGIVVHPVLWVIVIAAVLWLFFRRRSRA